MDRADPLAHARERFLLPDETIYLDGNSLGALPASAPRRIADVVAREWGQDLIRSWNTNGWIDLPVRIGRQIASLIGAEADEVIVADSTSVNLFKLAAAAVRDRASRRVVLSEQGNFPTDLYALQGLEDLLGGKITLRLVNRADIAYALSEERIMDDATGRYINANLRDYKLPRIGDIGELVVEFYEPDSEYNRGVIPYRAPVTAAKRESVLAARPGKRVVKRGNRMTPGHVRLIDERDRRAKRQR